MTSAAAVLACALALLGRSEESLPRIELIDERPSYVSANAEAFVDRRARTIYIVTTSSSFRAVQAASHRCGNKTELRKLASVIVHEEWHILNGRDERGAYLAQLTTLLWLGEREGSALVGSVQKSMNAVLDAQRREARLAAAR